MQTLTFGLIIVVVMIVLKKLISENYYNNLSYEVLKGTRMIFYNIIIILTVL